MLEEMKLKRIMGLHMRDLADLAGNSREKLTGPNSKGSQQWKIVSTLLIMVAKRLSPCSQPCKFCLSSLLCLQQDFKVSQKLGVDVWISPNSSSSNLLKVLFKFSGPERLKLYRYYDLFMGFAAA